MTIVMNFITLPKISKIIDFENLSEIELKTFSCKTIFIYFEESQIFFLLILTKIAARSAQLNKLPFLFVSLVIFMM